jgi:hypothetical protein
MFVARSFRVALVAAVALVLSAPAAEAAPKKKKAEQIVPTGHQDAAPPSAQDEAATEALEVMTSRSDEGLTEVMHEDGTVSMDLEGRFMHVLTAGVDAAGKPSASCDAPGDAPARAAAPRSHPTTPTDERAAADARRVVVVLPARIQTPALEEK